MWTRPVPASRVTNSPARNGRGLAKKPPRPCIGCFAVAPSSTAPFTSAINSSIFRPVRFMNAPIRFSSTRKRRPPQPKRM
ncbi:hypothetical protein WR25_25265 [Diploscapter pachys]|uniref:Uncharacterized protein n=1 Tax=Diploscapter pachys TaxID=2018661 RepID=A0A2A2M599_9BILA|nr:hypothetical protein WR25_25265 [Diploscapter pachys]